MTARLLSILAATSPVVHAASIWVEGELPATKSVQRHGWYDGVKRELMSGNDWLSHYGDQPGEVSYQLEVKEAGKYAAWARMK